MRRRSAWAFAAAVVFALILAGFVRWPIDPARTRDALNQAIGDGGRANWRAPQAASFSLLPRPALYIIGADLDDGSGVNLLSAPSVRLELGLAALAARRFEAKSAALFRPTLSIDLDRLPSLAKALGPMGRSAVARPTPKLTSISLREGLMRIFSAKRNIDTLARNVRGRIDGFGFSQPLGLALDAEWRNAPLAISVALKAPESFADGRESPFSFELASPIASLRLAGIVDGGETPHYEGDLSLRIKSLPALLRLAGAEVGRAFATREIALDGRASIDAAALSLEQAQITLAGQSLEGAIVLSIAGQRPMLSGNLAARQVAIEPILGPAPPLRASDRAWRREPPVSAIPRAFDLDMRLSIDKLDVYAHAFADVAASLILRDGGLAASLDDAKAADGEVRGGATIRQEADEISIITQGKIENADLGALFADFGWNGIVGRGDARIAIATHGRNVAEMASDLSGDIDLSVGPGVIAGVSLEEGLRRSQRRQIDPSRDLRPGGTPFAGIELRAEIEKGVARILNGQLTNPGLAASAEGSADIGEQSWQMHVTAVQTDARGGPSHDALPLLMAIEGPWAHPKIEAIAGAR